MKIRALDADGDWVFGQGKGSYLVGVDAIIQDIDTALQLFLGECFWNMNFGVDWFNLIGAKAPIAQQNIILQCRQLISTRQGVTNINRVDVTFTDFRRSLSIVYDISTIYGQTSNTFVKGFNNA
jgi:hypothetical protein